MSVKKKKKTARTLAGTKKLKNVPKASKSSKIGKSADLKKASKSSKVSKSSKSSKISKSADLKKVSKSSKVSKASKSSKIGKSADLKKASKSSKASKISKASQMSQAGKMDKTPSKASKTTQPSKKKSKAFKPSAKTFKKTEKKSKEQIAKNRKILELKRELEHLNTKEDIFTDVEGNRYCNEENCDQLAVTDIYCRYHYLALWPYLRNRKKLLQENYLSNTIQKLIKLFGEDALNCVLKDLKTEKNFELATKEINVFVEKEESFFSSKLDDF